MARLNSYSSGGNLSEPLGFFGEAHKLREGGEGGIARLDRGVPSDQRSDRPREFKRGHGSAAMNCLYAVKAGRSDRSALMMYHLPS